MKKYAVAVAAAFGLCVVAGSVGAEEQTLKFRLITMENQSLFVNAPNVEGHSVGAGAYAGVAVFEDGRIAHKDFVLAMDSHGTEGSYTGYSTYTFLDGDTLTLRFEGGWSPDGNGGDYTVLSGTGAFEGATGTGRFDGAKEPWEKAKLWDGSFSITLADK